MVCSVRGSSPSGDLPEDEKPPGMLHTRSKNKLHFDLIHGKSKSVRNPFWSYGSRQFESFRSAYGRALEVYDAGGAPLADEADDAVADVAPRMRR